MFAALMARVLGGFAPMRMNKSGTQSVAAGAVDVQVTNWTADAGFPETVITSHRLVVKAGTGKTVTAALAFTGTNGWNKSAKVRKNGVQIGTTQSSTASSGTFNFSITLQDFNEGDTLELVASASSVGITVQVAGTFLRVETP